MTSVFNERRKAPRYLSKLDIDIVLQDGTILGVQTLNISLNGLQFTCEGYIANEIEPRGIQNHPLDHLQVNVIATLPVDDEQKLYAICQVVTARRLSQEEYQLGLEFIDFEKNSDKVLQRYIDKLSAEELG